MSDAFRFPVTVRYGECDMQGIVFNAHYLAWFDEAVTHYFGHLGFEYAALLESGFDIILAHTEIDWDRPVRWRDDVAISVRPARLGTTSFTLSLRVLVSDEPHVRADTVYVVIGEADQRKRPIPDDIRSALEAEMVPAGE